jgi:cytochrome c biogenesis protein CcmG, thiol:disulfide interchange protein DsbE
VRPGDVRGGAFARTRDTNPTMSYRASALRLSLVLASLSLFACGSAGADGKGSSSGGDTGGLVGNPAPDFSVKSVSGGSGTVSLKSLRGKVVLVDFWGTFCEPCKKSFPKLQDLNTKYSTSGLRIVGISEDEADDKDKIPGFASNYGAKFPLGWDEDKVIAKSYKPDTMPSSFIIDKKGVVRYAHVGFHDGEEVEIEKEIKELLGQ